MTNLNYNEGIHYFITREVEPIVDDGIGNYNISPIGFPIHNVSGNFNKNPTRITPEFIVGYNNVVDGSTRLIVDYTENVKSIDNLVGIKVFSNDIASITRSILTATVTTVHDHGYVTGKTVTINGTHQEEYSGDFIITVVNKNTFTYTVSGVPASPATGNITSSYKCNANDLIVLKAQDNSDANGYYVVTENQWRVLYITYSDNMDVKVNANTNVDISIGSNPTYMFTVDKINTISLGTGKLLAEITTTQDNGFADGNLVTISNSIYPEYNQLDVPIQRISGRVFRYEVITDPGSDFTGSATVEYTVSDGDLVNLVNQIDETENGLYIARTLSAWEFYGFFYKWDGTENDNVAGEYSDEVDANGYPINHYRKGYSLEETANFLKDKLGMQLEFGQFKGSSRPLKDHGAFVQWLMSGRKVNIAGVGSSRDAFIDGFGFGSPNRYKRSIVTSGVVNIKDPIAVEAKKTQISMQNKRTVWGLTNHHSHALDGFFNKSPFVKDYPFIYNSEYNEYDPYGFLTAGHLPDDVDVERWRMTFTGITTSTDTNIRPIMIDTLWYQRDNSYHNNITVDVTDPNMVGRHSMSIINNFDTEDKIVLSQQSISNTSINPLTNVVTVPDGTLWMVGDYAQFMNVGDATLPSGLVRYKTYIVESVNSNDLTFTGVNITDTGNGTFTIERHVFDPYNNTEVVTSLDDISGVTFPINGVNYVTVLSRTVDNVTNYYIKPRKKTSLNLLLPKGSAWSESTLTYDAAGSNGINVYLESTEMYFVTFTHPTMSTTDLMDELNQHNDMIPVPFDPLTTDIDSLTSVFVDNSLVDYSDVINKSNKIRSKKTFIHLPTPIGLSDGTPFELDVSLPIVPESNSFPFNTIGSLSGYKNYITQPRVYVMSGYQKFKCDNYIINSLTHVDGDATIELATDHGIYTSIFTDSDVDVNGNYISISNWKDISIGDVVRFKSDGILPSAIPTITSSTDYVVTVVEFGKIKIASDTGTNINIIDASGGGNHSIVIQSAIKFDMRGSTYIDYNKQFVGHIYDFNLIKFTVNPSAITPAPGQLILDRLITVTGSNGIKGLNERYNSSIFSPMPEVEFAESGNLYHQGFNVDNLNGNGLVGNDRDVRTLVASVYPTTTSTFAWRIDNNPRIRMLQWSLMNVSALGGSAETGSFSNVAYKRNRSIYNEFSLVFKDGINGKFSVYDNPLSYVDIKDPTFTQQQINAFVRIRYPDSLVPKTQSDILSQEDSDTVGSFLYQASEAYSDLIRDFQSGRVLINSNNTRLDEYKASLPMNHNGVTEIPNSFFDNHTTSKFIDFTSVDAMTSDVEYDAYQRWYTKNIYAPKYIVDAQGSTELIAYDAYRNVNIILKDYINSFYTNSNVRVSSANNRYIYDVLNPVIDPEFEFSVGSDHKFIDYVIANSDGMSLVSNSLDDIRRRLWDSSYVIPNVNERKIQNAYHITSNGTSIEDSAKFHGASWIPFAKVFSTDGVAPSENSIVDIVDYSSIISGSYPALNRTLENAIASNLIAERFKSFYGDGSGNQSHDAYIESFVSVNTVNTVNSDKEEFLRNYVTGYANRLPFRFYNGFKISVTGREDSIAYGNDITHQLVDNESGVERIYKYSTNNYLNSYISTPNVDVGQYINDNFVFRELEDDSDVNVYAHDLNPSWWYFDEGNPLTDPNNSKVNDMITVSGMNHIADREFYTSKMKYNYTRIKMSFVFSEKLGRWMLLDYRQAPTSYLTPTFGSTALHQRERSTVIAGESNMDVINYVNALQPDIANSFTLRNLGDGRLVKVNGEVEFSVGDIVSMYIEGSNKSVINRINKIDNISNLGSPIPIYIYSFDNQLPAQFESFGAIQISHTINTIVSGEYPINLLSGIQSTDFLWKDLSCIDSANAYKTLISTSYHNMSPMSLNPNCYPFLSEEFPYDVDGKLKSVLDYTYDSIGAENYRLTRLIEPNLVSPNGINFIVPNNVHGGRIDADESLFLYQPHMWKVFWHMRPAVCSMLGTDIPSPISRTGGEMADPVLNNMFCYPDTRNPKYYIPWHNDMNLDWLNSGWLLIDAKIEDPDINPERDMYNEIDAIIVDDDDERNEFWEIESSDVTANERDNVNQPHD